MSVNVTVRANTSPMERDVFASIDRINRSGKLKLNIDDKGVTQPLGNMRRSADEFTKSLEASNSRVIAFGASVMVINSISDAFKGLVKQTIEVEKHLANINVVMGLTNRGLEKFSSGLFKVARETAQSFNTASEAATEFARQGLSVEETLKRTRDAMILTRLTGMGAEDSVKNLTAAMNTFGGQVKDSTELVSKFAAVDVKFAVSAEDFAQAISRAGASAKSAGVDLDEFIGMVTAAQQKTARGGAVIGNSLKTIFTRIQKPETLRTLEAVGIAVKDLEGKTLGAKRILTDLAQRFDTLTESQKAQVAQQTAGIFQINILKAVLGDAASQQSILTEATKISSGATDEAIEKNAMLSKTFAAAYTEAGLAVQELAKKIGELALAPGISKVLDTIKGAADWMSGLLGEGEEGGSFFAKGFLRGVGNILTGPGLVVFAAVVGKLFMNAFKFARESLKSVLGITTETTRQKQIQQSLLMVLAQNKGMQDELLAKGVSRSKQEKIILGVIKQQTLEAQKLQQLAASLAPALSRAGVGSNLAMNRGKAGGYIPNYADAATQERREATKGGYVAGTIKQGPGFLYNSRETIKKFPGMQEAAIMPPENSKAGANYRTSFIGQHGFDPYIAAGGHIPNFALKPKRGRSIGRYQKDEGVTLSRSQAQALGYKDSQLGQHFGAAAAVSKTKGSPWAQFKKKFSRSDLGLLSKNYQVKASTWLLHAQSGGAGQNLGYFQNPKHLRGGMNLTKVNTTGGVTPITQSLANINKISPSPYSGPTLTYNASGSSRGKSTSLHDAISGGLNDALTKIYRNYLPKSMRTKKFKLADTGQEGQLNQTVGRIFENILTQAIGAKAGSESERMDIPRQALSNNPKAKKLLEEIYGVQMNEAEIKHGQTPDSLGSYLGKLVSPSVNGISGLNFSGLKEVSGKINVMGSVAKRIRQTAVKALGFIPNFANPLSDAIGRERSAGIPVSQIRVGSHSKLVNKGNPLGLGVTNTRDEPRGLMDVLAGGFLPNFAGSGSSKGITQAIRDGFRNLKERWANKARGRDVRAGDGSVGKADRREKLFGEGGFGGVSPESVDAIEVEYEKLKEALAKETESHEQVVAEEKKNEKIGGMSVKEKIKKEKAIISEKEETIKKYDEGTHAARKFVRKDGKDTKDLTPEYKRVQRDLTNAKKRLKTATDKDTKSTTRLSQSSAKLKTAQDRAASSRGRLKSAKGGGFLGKLGGMATPMMLAAPMIGGMLEQWGNSGMERAQKELAAGNLDAAALTDSEKGRATWTKGASGALSGAASGAMMGAAIGSVIPGVGTAIGGVVGGLAGIFLGAKKGSEEAQQAAAEHAAALKKAKEAQEKLTSSYIIAGETASRAFNAVAELNLNNRLSTPAFDNPTRGSQISAKDYYGFEKGDTLGDTFDKMYTKSITNQGLQSDYEKHALAEFKKRNPNEKLTKKAMVEEYVAYQDHYGNTHYTKQMVERDVDSDKLASFKGQFKKDLEKEEMTQLTDQKKLLANLMSDNLEEEFDYQGGKKTGKQIRDEIEGANLSTEEGRNTIKAHMKAGKSVMDKQRKAYEKHVEGVLKTLKLERTKLRLQNQIKQKISKIGQSYQNIAHALEMEEAVHGQWMDEGAKVKLKYNKAMLKAARAYDEGAAKIKGQTKVALVAQLEKDENLKAEFTKLLTGKKTKGELLGKGLLNADEMKYLEDDYKDGEIKLIDEMEEGRFANLLAYLAEFKLGNDHLGETIKTRLYSQGLEMENLQNARNLSEDRASKEEKINSIYAAREKIVREIRKHEEWVSILHDEEASKKEFESLRRQHDIQKKMTVGGDALSHSQKNKLEERMAAEKGEEQIRKLEEEQQKKAWERMSKYKFGPNNKTLMESDLLSDQDVKELMGAGSFKELRGIIQPKIDAYAKASDKEKQAGLHHFKPYREANFEYRQAAAREAANQKLIDDAKSAAKAGADIGNRILTGKGYKKDDLSNIGVSTVKAMTGAKAFDFQGKEIDQNLIERTRLDPRKRSPDVRETQYGLKDSATVVAKNWVGELEDTGILQSKLQKRRYLGGSINSVTGTVTESALDREYKDKALAIQKQGWINYMGDPKNWAATNKTQEANMEKTWTTVRSDLGEKILIGQIEQFEKLLAEQMGSDDFAKIAKKHGEEYARDDAETRAATKYREILSQDGAGEVKDMGIKWKGKITDADTDQLLLAVQISREYQAQTERIKEAEKGQKALTEETGKQLKNLNAAKGLYDNKLNSLNQFVNQMKKLEGMDEEEVGRLGTKLKWEQELAKLEREKKTGPGAWKRGFAEARGTMIRETEEFSYHLTNQIGFGFRDAMVGAMEAAIYKADDLKSALMNVAAGFLQAINKALMTNIANNIVSGFMPKPAGMKSGGKVNARVSNGEFLMNRGAVKKYGTGFMNSVNSGHLPGFAKGGEFSPREQVLRGEMFTGRYTRMPVSSHFLATNQNVQLQEDRSFAKSEYQRAIQEAHQKRVKKAQMKRQILGMALSAAVAGAMHGAFSGGGGSLDGKSVTLGEGQASELGLDPGKYTDIGGGMLKGPGGVELPHDMLTGYEFQGAGLNTWGTGNAGMGSSLQTQDLPPWYQRTRVWKGLAGHGDYTGGSFQGWHKEKKAQGGLIQGRGGVDNIPAMLSEGEYVIRGDAVRKLGLPALNAINAGKFAQGGPTSNIEGDSKPTSSKPGDNTNNVNITVNVENGGQEGETKTEGDGAQVEQMQQLGKIIKEKVLITIHEEQRPGGLLAR